MKRLNNLFVTYRFPFVSGFLLSMTLPPIDAGFIGIFALIPLILWIKKSTLRQSLIGGCLAGAIYFGTLLMPLLSLNVWWWIGQGTWMFEYRKIVLCLILGLALMWGSILIGVFSLLYKKYSRGLWKDIFIFPFVWIFLEFVRAYGVSGFTWGHLGYTLRDWPNIAWLAHITTVYGLSFVVITINILLSYGMQSLVESYQRKEKIWSFKTAKILYAIIGIAIFITTIGNKNDWQMPSELKVAVVHSNLSTEETVGLRGFEKYENQILEALGVNPDMIVLPENAFPFFVLDRKNNLPIGYDIAESPIQTLWDRLQLLSTNAPNTAFIIGAHFVDNSQEFNSMILLQNGSIKGIYDKQNLFPIAETAPKNLARNRTDLIQKGLKNQPPFVIKNMPFSTLICSEIAIVNPIATGNPLTVSVSNDGIFASVLFAQGNHIMARMRAMETKSYLIRSVKGGISSVIDPKGRVLKSVSAQTNGNSTILFTIPKN